MGGVAGFSSLDLQRRCPLRLVMMVSWYQVGTNHQNGYVKCVQLDVYQVYLSRPGEEKILSLVDPSHSTFKVVNLWIQVRIITLTLLGKIA